MHEPSDRSAGPMAALTSLTGISDRTSDRLRKLLAVYFLGGSVVRIGRKQWLAARERVTYTVAVPGDDSIYDEVHAWLLESLEPRRRRAVTARSTRNYNNEVPVPVNRQGPVERRRKGKMVFSFDSAREQTVTISGHRVKVVIDRRDGRIDKDAGWDFMRRMERIVFTCPDGPARQAVLDFLGEVAARTLGETPSFFMYGRWGDWVNRDELGRRSIDSVVLRAGQTEDLVEDITGFLASEQEYLKLGIPWHRGYLFWGPPGTGKTSLARAIANHFDLDVYYIPLGDLQSDTSLMQVISQVRPGALLLLEDIDVLSAAHDRDEGAPEGGRKYGVSLSGLLNSLDGVGTPHGLITVLTTNKRDVLDDALIRPGRVDLELEVGFLDDEQLHRLARTFIAEGPVEFPPIGDRDVRPAAVIEAIKRNLHDHESAVTAIKELLA